MPRMIANPSSDPNIAQGARKLWRSVSIGGLNRLKQLTMLSPGWKYRGSGQEITQFLYRFPQLEVYDRYMKNKQYDHLDEWNPDLITQQNDTRKRQPKLIFPLPSIASDMFCSLVTGEEAKLTLNVEDEALQEKIDNFMKKSMLWGCISSAFPSFFANGSMFIRFFVTDNKKKLILEPHNTKSCWPKFDDNEDLESVKIRYIYDTGKVDKRQQPIWKWAQYELFKNKDVEYDNPIFDHNEKTPPVFSPVLTINHGLGEVQGVWIKNGFDPTSDDGKSLLEGALDFLDNLNYMSGKESDSLYHSLYPTLLGFGVDEIDLQKGAVKLTGGEALITSEKPPDKADLRFLENSNSGISLSDIYVQRNMVFLQHILKVTLPNPEVLLGYAQSAEAMKMLYKPIISEVQNMRPFLENGICELLERIEMATGDLEWGLPKGTTKLAKKKWGDIFKATQTDIAQKVTSAVSASQARVISRKTSSEFLAPDFGVSNVEEELKRIEEEAQQDMEEDLLRFDQETNISNKANPPQVKPKTNPKQGGKK